MTHRNHAWTESPTDRTISTCRNGCGCMRSLSAAGLVYARPDGMGGLVREVLPPRCETSERPEAA